MKIRIYHARILTMEEDRPIFWGELQIVGNRIQYVGPEMRSEERRLGTEC